jgi:hypothetical protein
VIVIGNMEWFLLSELQEGSGDQDVEPGQQPNRQGDGHGHGGGDVGEVLEARRHGGKSFLVVTSSATC